MKSGKELRLQKFIVIFLGQKAIWDEIVNIRPVNSVQAIVPKCEPWWKKNT